MHKQKGMTLLSWLIIIIFLLFQGVMAIKIVPVYLSDSTVKSIVEKLGNDPAMRGVTGEKIRETILKRLKINNIYHVKKEHIKIKKARNGYLVTIDYEPRGTLVGSLDYIMTFKHEAVVPTR